MTEPASRHYVSQRLSLHYVDWGASGAAPMVFVHGGRDHCRSWDRIARAFRNDAHVLATDLRGHGASDWSTDRDYHLMDYVYDLATFVQQLDRSPVTLVGHSLGGNIAIRFAGLYPDTVRRLVAIEGLGPSPAMQRERQAVPTADRVRQWIAARQRATSMTPKTYASIDAAIDRMCAVNEHLSHEQASHLTRHGVTHNADGTVSWKFDPCVRLFSPIDLTQADFESLWAAITCPVLLCYGAESWASNPARDGRAERFADARVVEYDNAGHWPHHDQTDAFINDLRAFLQ
ncbi:MAG: alpha/beta hydrolase [Pseudomonadota bacterium]